MKTMNRLKPSTTLLILLLATLWSAGCDTNEDVAGTYYGSQASLGNGSVRTFVRLDAEGNPTAVGVTLTEAALTGLPDGGDHEENMTELDLPAEATHLPIDHVSVDWNPHGHEPPGIYEQPHFDFHFYLMTRAQRDAIDPTASDFGEKAGRAPAEAHIPAGYIPTPGAVPRMGAHWIDPTSPELNGETFTRTFIYGFWDGQMNFLEPMITEAFIESVKQAPGQAVTFAIPQPQAFAKAGYYPTRYAVRYDAKEKVYQVALEELRPH